MSNLESVEKLRKCAYPLPEFDSVDEMLWHEYGETTTHFALVAACDEIEREVAGRSVALPVDADGEAIRIGDVIESRFEEPTEVTEMQLTLSRGIEPRWTLLWGEGGGALDEDWGEFPDSPSAYRHHRKPTVEDVLEEFWRENVDGVRTPTTEAFGRWADKLREAVRGE